MSLGGLKNIKGEFMKLVGCGGSIVFLLRFLKIIIRGFCFITLADRLIDRFKGERERDNLFDFFIKKFEFYIFLLLFFFIDSLQLFSNPASSNSFINSFSLFRWSLHFINNFLIYCFIPYHFHQSFNLTNDW